MELCSTKTPSPAPKGNLGRGPFHGSWGPLRELDTWVPCGSIALERLFPFFLLCLSHRPGSAKLFQRRLDLFGINVFFADPTDEQGAYLFETTVIRRSVIRCRDIEEN